MVNHIPESDLCGDAPLDGVRPGGDRSQDRDSSQIVSTERTVGHSRTLPRALSIYRPRDGNLCRLTRSHYKKKGSDLVTLGQCCECHLS